MHEKQFPAFPPKSGPRWEDLVHPSPTPEASSAALEVVITADNGMTQASREVIGDRVNQMWLACTLNITQNRRRDVRLMNCGMESSPRRLLKG